MNLDWRRRKRVRSSARISRVAATDPDSAPARRAVGLLMRIVVLGAVVAQGCSTGGGDEAADVPPCPTTGTVSQRAPISGPGSLLVLRDCGGENEDSETTSQLLVVTSVGAFQVPGATWTGDVVGWSPAGDRIVAEARKGGTTVIRVAGVDGTGAEDVSATSADAGSAHQPSWSPDGEWIVYLVDPGPPEAATLWRVRPDGSGSAQLTEPGVDDSEEQGSDSLVCWSADGQRIAFRHLEAGTWELRVINIDGTGLRTLGESAQEITGCSWSPDGQAVVAGHSDRRSGGLTLYREDDRPESLPVGERPTYSPSWSPDGATIVVTQGRMGSLRLYSFDVASRTIEKITDEAGDQLAPTWSDGGGQIAYGCVLDDRDGLCVMNWPTKTVRRVATGGSMWIPAWSPNTP